MIVFRTLGVALLVGTVAHGCSSRTSPEHERDSGIQPRVFNPPPSRVRAVPPHNVHAQGIGPYELGAPLKKVLNILPHGPRIELFRLGRLADFSLARTENGGLLVGVGREAGVTSFVAAVAEKIAITGDGAGVGSTVGDIERELGPQLERPERISDPRLLRFDKLPGVGFVSQGRGGDKDVIGAILVDGLDIEPKATAESLCRLDKKNSGEILGAARLGSSARVVPLCDRQGKAIGAVVYAGKRILWMSLDKGKFKRSAAVGVSNLIFAGPIAAPADDGETQALFVAAVSQVRSDAELTLNLETWRIEGMRLVPSSSGRVYSLSAAEVSWVGSQMRGLEILASLEMTSATELEVHGVYVDRRSGRIAMTAPLEKVEFSLKRRTSANRKGEPVLDAGANDAGTAKKVKDAGPATKKNKTKKAIDAASRPSVRPRERTRPN